METEAEIGVTQPRETRTSGGRTYPELTTWALPSVPCRGAYGRTARWPGWGRRHPGRMEQACHRGCSPVSSGKSAMKTLEGKWPLGVELPSLPAPSTPSPRPGGQPSPAEPRGPATGLETLPG